MKMKETVAWAVYNPKDGKVWHDDIENLLEIYKSRKAARYHKSDCERVVKVIIKEA